MQIRKGIILVSIWPIVLFLSVKVKRCTGNEEEVKFNCVVCSFARVKMTSNHVVGDQTGKKNIQSHSVLFSCHWLQGGADACKNSEEISSLLRVCVCQSTHLILVLFYIHDSAAHTHGPPLVKVIGWVCMCVCITAVMTCCSICESLCRDTIKCIYTYT